jgi:hypothetical protein
MREGEYTVFCLRKRYLVLFVALLGVSCAGGSDDDDHAGDDDANAVDDDTTDDDLDDDGDGDDDLTDDDADDDTDDDTDDDATDDDSVDDDASDDDTSFCEDPSLIQPDACGLGMAELYCWFGAPIIVDSVSYSQHKAVEQCRSEPNETWAVIHACIGEIWLDAFTVWLYPLVNCLADAGTPWAYPNLFSPAEWRPTGDSSWEYAVQALNLWSYYSPLYASELSGAVAYPDLPAFRGSRSMEYIGMGYFSVLYGRGDSTVFDDTQLVFDMRGFFFRSTPLILWPWHRPVVMEPLRSI